MCLLKCQMSSPPLASFVLKLIWFCSPLYNVQYGMNITLYIWYAQLSIRQLKPHANSSWFASQMEMVVSVLFLHRLQSTYIGNEERRLRSNGKIFGWMMIIILKPFKGSLLDCILSKYHSNTLHQPEMVWYFASLMSFPAMVLFNSSSFSTLSWNMQSWSSVHM